MDICLWSEDLDCGLCPVKGDGRSGKDTGVRGMNMLRIVVLFSGHMANTSPSSGPWASLLFLKQVKSIKCNSCIFRQKFKSHYGNRHAEEVRARWKSLTRGKNAAIFSATLMVRVQFSCIKIHYQTFPLICFSCRREADLDCLIPVIAFFLQFRRRIRPVRHRSSSFRNGWNVT